MIVDVVCQSSTIFQYGSVEEYVRSGRSSSGISLDKRSSVVMWLEVKNVLTLASMTSNSNEGIAWNKSLETVV